MRDNRKDLQKHCLLTKRRQLHYLLWFAFCRGRANCTNGAFYTVHRLVFYQVEYLYMKRRMVYQH